MLLWGLLIVTLMCFMTRFIALGIQIFVIGNIVVYLLALHYRNLNP